MKKRISFLSFSQALFRAIIVGFILGSVALGSIPAMLTIAMIIFTASFISMPKGAACFGLQREVWLPSLKDEYVKDPTWLDEAEDLSIFVDKNQYINFAESGADPAVYENAAGDIDSVEPTETPHQVSLDTYDSQNYKIKQANLSALPYEKIEHYTRKSAKAIRLKEALRAAHTFTPDGAGVKKIVIATTGANDGTGLKMATLDDILNLATGCDNADFPGGRNLVLTSNMWWQLVKNNDILKGQLQYQQNTGIIDPKMVNYYGFKIHNYNHQVGFNVALGAKAAIGAAYAGDIVPVGFVFCRQEVFRAGGEFLMSYTPASQNPKGRAHEFGFQHRFKSGFQRTAQKYSAILYAAKVA